MNLQRGKNEKSKDCIWRVTAVMCWIQLALTCLNGSCNSFSSVQFSSAQFSRSVVSNSLQPHESQPY